MPITKPSMTNQYRRIKTCLIVMGLTCYRLAEFKVDHCEMRTINILRLAVTTRFRRSQMAAFGKRIHRSRSFKRASITASALVGVGPDNQIK
jgi:hypothetical protein